MCIPSIEARSTERGYESIVKYCFFIVLVLIDTWWNVNYIQQSKILNPNKVLIDTWWNVNINNYDSHTKSITVLIDTWWNVNVKQIKEDKTMRKSFNRYMVECE